MDAIVLDFGTGDDQIEGECQLEGEEGKIMCVGFHHGVAMPLNWDVSNMKRTIGKTRHEDFVVTKKCDLATPKLNFYCSVGKRFESVTIKMYQADGEDDFVSFLEYTLSDAIIANIVTEGGKMPFGWHMRGGSDGKSPLDDVVGDSDIPIERLSLNYSKIQWLYKKQKTDVAQEGQSAYEFDLTKAKGAAS